MGYETKLIIGKSTCLFSEDGDMLFIEYASIDLCKTGSSSFVSKVDWKNDNPDMSAWYWYDGASRIKEDCYGDFPKPVPISVVVDALKKDITKSDYRRFKWALALLESMQDDSENLQVLYYGH